MTALAAGQVLRIPRILVLEHDPSDPPLRLGEWLAEAGAQVHVRRLHAGDEVPDGPQGWDALISMGGDLSADDDDLTPWLPATRRLLAAAVAAGTPTLGICLGAQLLAAATGGRVERVTDGPEIGAYLLAKRDVAEQDPLFAHVPITPDVMHYHHDVVSVLPPGAVLLFSSIGYPHQAFRIGSAAWGLQCHIETTAAVLRSWVAGRPEDDVEGGDVEGGDDGGSTRGAVAARVAGHPDRPSRSAGRRELDPADRARATRRCGPALDEAEELMGTVWRAFAHRFAELARVGVAPTPTGRAGPRLPIVGGPRAEPG